MQEGDRVRLRRDVERYPHFTVPEGQTGTVVEASDELIAVRLDEPVEGAEEWDNQLRWYPDMYDDSDFREAFRQDIEPLS